jgi:hypothetical protein
MTTSRRSELLRVLGELSDAHPEIRLGQLVANLSYLARGPANESIWDAEDEELLAAASQLLEQQNATNRAAV